MGVYAREEGYLLWYSAEVYPTEEDGQNHTVIMQHALGNTVVYGLEGRRCGREEEEGREWKEEGGEGGREGKPAYQLTNLKELMQPTTKLLSECSVQTMSKMVALLLASRKTFSASLQLIFWRQ